jgi:hypothetical protein
MESNNVLAVLVFFDSYAANTRQREQLGRMPPLNLANLLLCFHEPPLFHDPGSGQLHAHRLHDVFKVVGDGMARRTREEKSHGDLRLSLKNERSGIAGIAEYLALQTVFILSLLAARTMTLAVRSFRQNLIRG